MIKEVTNVNEKLADCNATFLSSALLCTKHYKPQSVMFKVVRASASVDSMKTSATLQKHIRRKKR